MAQSVAFPVAIEIEGLNKRYARRGQSPVHAVQDVNLQVAPGQVFGFLGPNGAGKTTTIKMACSLVKPTTGRILLHGYDVARERPQAMRQIGAVLEGTRNVYWRLSAWNNLIYFGQHKGVRGKVLRQRTETLLRELELWDRRNDPVRLFSRGMIQKVAIACALIADPPIILLDEPTLGLDVQAARTVQQWVDRLAHERGKTVVLTTHRLEMAQNLCDRIAIISKGKIITDKPVQQLLQIFGHEYYQIKIRGSLNDQTKALQHSLTATEDNGATVLTGRIGSQTELYRILDGVRDAGLELEAVMPVEPDLEEIFVRFMEAEGAKAS